MKKEKAKPNCTYTCPYCGKAHKTAVDMILCDCREDEPDKDIPPIEFYNLH